jgi:hypothetical protein
MRKNIDYGHNKMNNTLNNKHLMSLLTWSTMQYVHHIDKHYEKIVSIATCPLQLKNV